MSALAAPRIRFRLGFGGVLTIRDQSQLMVGERTPLARLQLAEHHGADAGAHQSEHRVTDGVEHAAYLPVFALVQDQFQNRGARLVPAGKKRRPGGSGHVAVAEFQAAGEAVHRVWVGLPAHRRDIGLAHTLAGVCHLEDEIAVVRHQE